MKPLDKVRLEFLRVFESVARHESMTAAARELCVTQPAVSRSVALLEEELGVRLFIRRGKTLLPTPEGRALFETTREVFETLGRGQEKLERMRALSEGDIRLALPFRLLNHFLLPHLRHFHSLYPKVRFHIQVENRRSELLGLLESGRVDFFLDTSHNEEAARPGVETVPLARYRNFFAASRAAYGDLEGRELDLAEVNRHPLIVLRSGADSRIFLERTFTQAGLELNIGSECDTSAVVEEFTKAGLGLGALIRKTGADAQGLGGDLFEVRLRNPLAEGSFVLCRRTDSELPQAASFFVELVVSRA